MAISVGNTISTPNSTFGNSNFLLLKNNTVTANGIINTINIYCLYVNATPTVGFFYDDGTNYVCRSYASLGTVTFGSMQTINGLNLPVQAGDMLGIRFDAGFMGYITSTTDLAVIYTTSFPSTSIDKNAGFTSYTDRFIMVNGSGVEAGKKINSILYGKWNGINPSKWNGI